MDNFVDERDLKILEDDKYILHSADSERYERQKAINKMIHEISSILSDCEPSIYLYGRAG